MYVLDNECEDVEALKKDMEHFKLTAARQKDELTAVLEEMTQTVITYEAELEQCTISTAKENNGKTMEEVSPRQARRKLKQVSTFAEQALWFAELLGLVPEYVMFHKAQSGESMKISFDFETPQKNAISPQHSDYNMLHQVLYILGRFAVSDEAYHELSMISNLPPLHKEKTVRLSLNNSLDLKRFPEAHLGAYRPFEATLKNEIARGNNQRYR